VVLVRTNVSGELSASIIRVTRMMEALSYSETSVPTRATRRNIPEDAILKNFCDFFIVSKEAFGKVDRKICLFLTPVDQRSASFF
jgi:hypothetical protein